MPERKPQQPIWKKLRKRRRENLPTQMVITVGVLGLIAFAATNGIFRDQSSSELTGSALPEGRQLQTRTVVDFAFPESCPVPAPSASTFPSVGFDHATQKAEATIFYLVITIFMFLGLAIVCDQFFEASLSAICEAQNLKDDVAGATWMAAGGSAPELATSIIGVFISRSDVGIGTIVGSAVFNVLFVIACCAFVAPNLKLTWWPLARDASYYCFALAMIVFFISDDLQIAVWEATTLLLMYAGYVTIMYFNESLEEWVTAKVAKDEESKSPLQLSIIKMIDNPIFSACLYLAILANSIIVILEIDVFNQESIKLPCVCDIAVGAASIPATGLYYVNLGFNIFFILEMCVKFFAYGFFGYWKVPLNCFDGSLVFLIVVELVLNSATAPSPDADPFSDAGDDIGVGVARLFRLLKFVRFIRMLRFGRVVMKLVGMAQGTDSQVTPEDGKVRTDEKSGKDVEGEPAKEEEEEEDDDDEPFNPMEIPDSAVGKFFWVLGLPLSFAMWLTIPDCRREMFKKWWLATFGMCIVWIGLLATVMVWMVEQFGFLYEVRPSIMGVTLLAAGTSIPDCLSSVAVAKRGHGDMAVSSSIGSNIFDVLIGLPVPWFLYTAILRPAGALDGPQWVKIDSEALAVMILSLFIMVALVITTIHLSGWILSVKLGIMMMVLYFFFLILSLLLDYKVIFPLCTDNKELFTFTNGNF
jgi:K+-dependent Na+/Ca+ exchanger-like protein